MAAKDNFNPDQPKRPYINFKNILGLTKAKFASLVLDRARLSAEIQERQTKLATLNTRIVGLLEHCHHDRVECAGYRLTYIPPSKRTSLSKTRLLELGVSPKIIKKATVESTTAASVRFMAPEEEE